MCCLLLAAGVSEKLVFLSAVVLIWLDGAAEEARRLEKLEKEGVRRWYPFLCKISPWFADTKNESLSHINLHSPTTIVVVAGLLTDRDDGENGDQRASLGHPAR